MKATEFLRTIANLTGSPRDKQVVEAAKTSLRRWEWVTVPLNDGRGFFRVASDYVAIGEHTDWVRVPMGGLAAQAIADQEQAVLPSPYMVQLIHQAATVKLRPVELGPSKMMSTARFAEHHAKIEALREGRAGLISGIKKDVVVSNKLETKPGSVCIFGWYRLNGSPIQSVSTKHEISYSDYSHGVRLVHPEMMLDGKQVLVQDVMRDPRVAAVLTGGQAWGKKHDADDDGVLKVVRYGKQPERTEPATPVIDLSPPKSNTLGDRCVDWCLGEMAKGVKEEPKGSKTSPRIAEYFAPARRRGTEKLLGIKAADWCAVAQSAALLANTQPGEDVPHGYRAAVRELREDAQQTGAWVPIADVRSGKYEVRRGDLLVLRRGSAGLGHVVRVQEAFKDHVLALGANEDDTWKRTMRSFDDKDLEGAISYHRFNPGLKLQPVAGANLLSSPPQAKPNDVTTAPDGANVDAWARGVVLRAWDSLFPGKPITPAELQCIMAVCRFERFYGLAKKPVAGIGKKNWGGVQCKKGECGPNCYPGGDIDKDGKPYPVCFRIYATDEEGAAAVIFQLTQRRPDVWDAMRSGNLTAVAHRMAVGRNVNGKWVGVYHETPPKQYAAGLWASVKTLATNLDEPLAVRLAENAPSTQQTVAPATTNTPAYAKPASMAHTPAYAPRKPANRQAGIRALVASRRPDLANVIVGAPPHHQSPALEQAAVLKQRLDKLGTAAAELRHDCECADAAFSRAIIPSTGGVTTSTQVLDHANRVHDYINALHKIVADARRERDASTDAFPWTEWAAFRVSWDLVYFDITHSFVPNFDDNVVTEYEAQAKKWEGIIASHYKKRPAVAPVLDGENTALKVGVGVAVGLGLLYAVTRGVS